MAPIEVGRAWREQRSKYHYKEATINRNCRSTLGTWLVREDGASTGYPLAKEAQLRFKLTDW